MICDGCLNCLKRRYLHEAEKTICLLDGKEIGLRLESCNWKEFPVHDPIFPIYDPPKEKVEDVPRETLEESPLIFGQGVYEIQSTPIAIPFPSEVEADLEESPRWTKHLKRGRGRPKKGR